MGIALESAVIFDSKRLEVVFNRCFGTSENTRLVGGASEPLYRPACSGQLQHLLFYREDFFASALHEIAHWCIAGEARRQLLDFGYWYAPEGRTATEQRDFERVEVKPQALEWCLSRACGYDFGISVDNFGAAGEIPDTSWFRAQVLEQAQVWQQVGLPPRARQLYTALCEEFGVDVALADQRFQPGDLS